MEKDILLEDIRFLHFFYVEFFENSNFLWQPILEKNIAGTFIIHGPSGLKYSPAKNAQTKKVNGLFRLSFKFFYV